MSLIWTFVFWKAANAYDSFSSEAELNNGRVCTIYANIASLAIIIIIIIVGGVVVVVISIISLF